MHIDSLVADEIMNVPLGQLLQTRILRLNMSLYNQIILTKCLSKTIKVTNVLACIEEWREKGDSAQSGGTRIHGLLLARIVMYVFAPAYVLNKGDDNSTDATYLTSESMLRPQTS